MDYPMIDNADAYIAVCEKANLPLNKLPKKGDKIELAYEMAMKELNPHLYQNITSPDPDELPVDVAKRYKQGLMWIQDLNAYEKCGFTGTAANIRKAMEQGQQELIAQKTAEMKARNDARDEAQRNKLHGFTPQKNIDFWSPSAVAFRRQHGISDDVGAGL